VTVVSPPPPAPPPPSPPEVRCRECRGVLCQGLPSLSQIIKCRHCGRFVDFARDKLAGVLLA